MKMFKTIKIRGFAAYRPRRRRAVQTVAGSTVHGILLACISAKYIYTDRRTKCCKTYSSRLHTVQYRLCMETRCGHDVLCYLKKNQNAPRPSKHPPVRGGGMSKRLGGIEGYKYKTSSWYINGFPYGNNIGSTVECRGEAHRYTVCVCVCIY